METEPCKLQDEKEEEMEEEMEEEGVGEDRNMLVMEGEDMGAGRDGPLTILIPRSPPPPREPGGLNIENAYSGHSSLISPLSFLKPF